MSLDREGYLRNLRELEAGREVFLRPLELEATADDVRDIVVQRCGEDSVAIDRVKLVKHAGGSLLSAFVTLSSVQEARLVTQRLDGAKVRGKVLAVSVARNQGQSRVKEICMFFLEGSCSRGENCKFSHERQDDAEEAGTAWDDVEEAGEVQQTEGLTSKHKRLKHPPDPPQTIKKKKTKDEATISAKTAPSSRPSREVQKRTKARRVPEQDGGEGDPHSDSLKAELKRKHRARNASTQSEAPVPQEETSEKKQKKVRRKTAAQDLPTVPTAAPAAKGQKPKKKRNKKLPKAAA